MSEPRKTIILNKSGLGGMRTPSGRTLSSVPKERTARKRRGGYRASKGAVKPQTPALPCVRVTVTIVESGVQHGKVQAKERMNAMASGGQGESLSHVCSSGLMD